MRPSWRQRRSSQPLSACSLSGRRRGRPHLPLLTGGTTSSVGASMRLSCWLAGPISTPSGVPLASTAMWRLLPGLLRSVGLGPVAAPPFLPAQTRCPGQRDASRAVLPREDAPAAPDARPPTLLPRASHAGAASSSCQSLTSSRRAASPTAGRTVARTGCRSAPHGPAGAAVLPFGFGASGGSSGAIAAHRSPGTRGLAMPYGTHQNKFR